MFYCFILYFFFIKEDHTNRSVCYAHNTYDQQDKAHCNAF